MTTNHTNQEKDRTFLARYGATILRGGIAAIPAALYRYMGELGLSFQHVGFVSAILAHKWDADLPHPSLVRMAAETGVSRRQLHRYEAELVERRLLSVINRRNHRGGQEANYYDFSVLFRKLEDLLERDRPPGGEGGYVTPVTHPPVSPASHPPVTGVSHYVEEEELESFPQNQLLISNRARDGGDDIKPVDNSLPPPRGKPRGRHATAQATENHSAVHTPTGGNGAEHPSTPDPGKTANSGRAGERSDGETTTARSRDGFTPLGELLSAGRLTEGVKIASGRDSTGGSPATGTNTLDSPNPALFSAPERTTATPSRRGRPPKPTPQIEAVMTDLSFKLSDVEHTRSNITHAMNLLRQTGVDELVLVSRLYEAASITRQQSTVKKRAGPGNAGIINRAPYFWAVVEDLLGLRNDAGLDQADHEPPRSENHPRPRAPS